MKTIEKASDDYGFSVASGTGVIELRYVAEKAFREGAEFAQRWIPVDEELPFESQNVLVCTNEKKVGLMWFSKEYRWHSLRNEAAVTHWMPLPKPI